MDSIIRKVSILRGRAKEAALEVGACDNDLVILKISDHPYPRYTADKIVGDPVSYLMREA